MKKINFSKVLITSALTLSLSSSLAFAATSTPSASPSTSQTATDSAVKNIKERVEKAIQTTDPQVKGLMTALKQAKFGIVGTLEKIVGSTLQIRTPRGILRVAELDHTAVILRGTKPISRQDIELNVPVIALGFRKDDTLLVRRLILTDESIFGTKRLTLFGKVDSITTKLLTLLTFKDGQQAAVPIKITAKTTYYNTLDDQIKRTDIKQGDPVIAVMPDDGTATASASRVYSLSPKAVPTPNTTAVNQ